MALTSPQIGYEHGIRKCLMKNTLNSTKQRWTFYYWFTGARFSKPSEHRNHLRRIFNALKVSFCLGHLGPLEILILQSAGGPMNLRFIKCPGDSDAGNPLTSLWENIGFILGNINCFVCIYYLFKEILSISRWMGGCLILRKKGCQRSSFRRLENFLEGMINRIWISKKRFPGSNSNMCMCTYTHTYIFHHFYVGWLILFLLNLNSWHI